MYIDGIVYIKPPVLFPDSGEFAWWSMRDGWGHYYLHDADGTLIRQLTEGTFNVDEVVDIDREDRDM